MVSYCCVKGCWNNSSEKKKRSSNQITFHAFPSNQVLRSRWLKAIGCETWNPPQHARICSVHFADQDINRDQQRTRLKESACPIVQVLDMVSDVDIQLETCRICLATDVKMYSLKKDNMNMYYKSVFSMSDAKTDNLPKFLCYECAALVLKCHKLIQKSIVAHDTLMAMISEHGEVTKILVNNTNRANLKSSLTYNSVVPKTVYDLTYDEDSKTYTHCDKREENIKKEKEDLTDFEDTKYVKNDEDVKITNVCPKDNFDDNFVSIMTEVKCDLSGNSDNGDGDKEYVMGNDDDDDDDNVPLVIAVKSKRRKNVVKKENGTKRKRSSIKSANTLTAEDIEMQKYFVVTILTLEEQIEERQRMKESDAYRDALYKCEVCYKTYLHPNAFNTHLENHDPRKGPAVCKVCGVRCKSEALAASHALRSHSKRFQCRTCPKTFYNVRIAKNHQMKHEISEYKCNNCDYSTSHQMRRKEVDLSAHTRTCLPPLICQYCAVPCASASALAQHVTSSHPDRMNVDYQITSQPLCCAQCNITFTDENNWREHIDHHKGTVPSLEVKCPQCDKKFKDRAELRTHREAHHEREKRMTWRMPGDNYPTECEHCGVTVRSRAEHYAHTRRSHPRLRALYRPVVTAVCDTCGQGFQNSTKLHLHELRHKGVGTVHCPHCPRLFYDKYQLNSTKLHLHELRHKGVGTVHCPHCPRLFYDKYQLARHIGVHSDERPFQCTLCDKAFKLRSNLDRHAKVHSGTTAYECTMCNKRFRYSSSRNLHVRTVHYKLPQPPRKKREKPRANYNTT